MEGSGGADYAAANSSAANSGDPCLQMLLQMLLGDQLEFDYENPWVNEFIDSFIPTTPPFLDPTHIDDGGLTDLSEDTFNGVMLAYTGIGLVDSSIGAVSSYLDASLNESLGFDIRFGPENLGSVPGITTLRLPATMTGELPTYQEAADQGLLIKTQSSTLPPSDARSIWEAANGPVPDGFDVDHIIQRQFGGSDDLSNLQLKPSGLNRSEGSQAMWLNKPFPYGTFFNDVELVSPK